jgi:hypothetical protein
MDQLCPFDFPSPIAKLVKSMGRCQLLRFLHLGQSIVVPPPGDQRLWKALNEALGNIACRRFSVLGLEWGDDVAAEALPSNEDWNRAYVLDGLTTVSLSMRNDALSLQRRRRGRDADAGALLAREWLIAQKKPAPMSVWCAESFEFDNASSADSLGDAIQGLLALGARSGMCESDVEEIRLLRAGASLAWPYPSQLQGDSGINASLERLSTDGASSLLRRRFRVQELRPRAQPVTSEAASPIVALSTLQRHSQVPVAGPLHMMAAVPRNSNAEATLVELRTLADQAAVLADRAQGILVLREATPSAASLEPIGQSDLSWSPLSGPPTAACRLWALGPWDLRNTLAARRVEAWSEELRSQVRGIPELLDGHDDWLLRVGRLLTSASGWALPLASGQALASAAWDRAATSRLLLFWSDATDEQLKRSTAEMGLSLMYLGHPNSSGKVEFQGGSTSQSVESLRESLAETYDDSEAVLARWSFPELKSPTYGFEKVAIFPDQYLMRVLNYGQRGWVHRQLAWPRSSGMQFRGVTMRNRGSFPLAWMRWASQDVSFAEAVGTQTQIATADPRAAGVLAVEMALRSLVAQGLRVGAPISGSVWLTCPHNDLNGEEGDEARAAYAMAFDGVVAAAFEAGIDLRDVQATASAPRSRKYVQEIAVRLRGPLDEEIQPVLPGFRMSGEALYAVGPRPPFVDLGSRILSHVRVLSNHITRLNWTSQVELYQLLHRCIKERFVTCVRPIGSGGIAEALAEMGLWSGIGVQLKPTVPTVEIFSGAPGRFLVGVLPQDAKRFEALVKGEWLTHVGATGGEKLFGLPLLRFAEERETPP